MPSINTDFKVSNPKQFPSLEQLRKEGAGSQQGTVQQSPGATWSPATIGLFQVPPGFGCYIESVTLTVKGADRLFYLNVVVYDGYYSGNPATGLLNTAPFGIVMVDATESKTVTIPIKRFVYEGGGINLYANGVTTNPTTQPGIYATTSAFLIQGDYNFNARKAVLHIGDSITYDTMGYDTSNSNKTYYGRYKYGQQVVDQLNRDGKSVRYINKGVSGSTTADMCNMIDNGFYDIPQGIDAIFLGYGGTNDITSSISTSTYTTNLQYAIGWRDRLYPLTPIFIIGAPTTDTASRAGLGAYRTAAAALANSGNKIYYYDASTAFGLNATPSLDVNFCVDGGGVNIRAAGSRLHPSGIGQTLIAFGPTGLASDNAGLYGVVKTIIT